MCLPPFFYPEIFIHPLFHPLILQISTRWKDYLVDTLVLWRELPRLSSVLLDPTVVKVLHGCDRDVLWLQRDFGLYLFNCFDSHVAAKVLKYPALSLAHLLKVRCTT